MLLLAAWEWSGARAERLLVLRAPGPFRRRLGADQVAVDVARRAGARVALRAVPVAVDGQQARPVELLRHGHRALVWGGRVVGGVEHQHPVRGAPVPGAAVAIGRGRAPARAAHAYPRPVPPDRSGALVGEGVQRWEGGGARVGALRTADGEGLSGDLPPRPRRRRGGCVARRPQVL